MATVGKITLITTDLDKKQIWAKWRVNENRRRRKLLLGMIEKQMSALLLRNPAGSRTAIQCYCGTFPIIPAIIASTESEKIRSMTGQLDNLPQKARWTDLEDNKVMRLLEATQKRITVILAQPWRHQR